MSKTVKNTHLAPVRIQEPHGTGRPAESDPMKAVARHARHRRANREPSSPLSVSESFAAFGVFLIWLALFAGGIVVDTAPYREAISATGANALVNGAAVQANAAPQTAPSGAQPGPSLWISWIVVLTCFLPINLAWLCAGAGTLGAFGNHANLADDRGKAMSHDNTNPYTSAVLRGFFVYLFMMSGLLLLDDSPFSHPSPGQYVRLAGFLSLFSFVVSYQPRLFSVLIVWAFHRIQVRERGDQESEESSSQTVSSKTTVAVEETQSVHSHSEHRPPVAET
jgi:hypothetical protein